MSFLWSVGLQVSFTCPVSWFITRKAPRQIGGATRHIQHPHAGTKPSLVDGEGYSNIVHGNSYIQAVTWDDSECPDAYAILTYSQSTDPASANYADATKLYSSGNWIDMPFCGAARDEQEISRETIEQ